MRDDTGSSSEALGTLVDHDSLGAPSDASIQQGSQAMGRSSQSSLTLPPYDKYVSNGVGLLSTATVIDDGRIGINLQFPNSISDLPADYAQDVSEFGIDHRPVAKPPQLKIVIMIVGSRGKSLSLIQPYSS